MNGDHDFEPTLRKWLGNTQAVNPGSPLMVYEWGPGKSSQIILEQDPMPVLITVEHNKGYYDRAVKAIGSRALVQLIPIGDKVTTYASSILQRDTRFDLVFVDGRRRVECCLTAIQRLEPHGVILLHDINSRPYLDQLKPYMDIIDQEHRTVVMKPKEFLR